MAARNESEQDAAGKPGENAVERSLEDFIARANTTLPAPEAPVALALGSGRKNRKQKERKKEPGTLVVLGPHKPLAEETEIVTRLPAAELAPPPRRLTTLRFGVIAFLAGAAAVLVITRVLAGGPKPLTPVATPVAAPAPAPPPIIVQPLPAPAPVVEPAPTAVLVEPEAAAPPEPAVVAPEKSKPSRAPARRAAAHRAASPKTDKKSPGLVDPFAP